MENLISVIMPVYNRAQTVDLAIQSVLRQSYPNFELIIVDDGSTDSTVEVVSGLSDPRIVFLQLEQNSGAAFARNQGIKKSKGRMISFLDSDDYYEPDFLKISYQTLSETPPKIGFMWTGVRYHGIDGIKESSWAPAYKENTYITFLNDLQIGTGAGICIKREVFDICGLFDETLPAAEDTEFFLRISQRFDYVYTKDILVNIHKNSADRLSENFIKVARAYNAFIESHLKEIEKDEELQKKFYYKLMWLNHRMKNSKKAWAYFKKAPKTNPKFVLKLGAVFCVYKLLGSNTAMKIHNRISQYIS